MKRLFSCMLIVVLFAVLLLSCGKNPAQEEKTDWKSFFEGNMVPSITSAPDSANIKITSENKEKPALTFKPTEDQVELVLLAVDDCWDIGLDEVLIDALNQLLQEKGYSFYLSIEMKDISSLSLSKWQEKIDSGEAIDLLAFTVEDRTKTYNEYGNTSVLRAIEEGYLLPFSEYPEIEAKFNLLAAYPARYWDLCSVNGEIYGVSPYVTGLIQEKNFLLLNLEAAKAADISVPEQLVLTNLDEMLTKASDKGIMGCYIDALTACNITWLPSGLYFQYDDVDNYRITNPFEDRNLLNLWDALHRYWKNGWISSDPIEQNQLPLVLCVKGSYYNWDGNRYIYRTSNGEVSAEVKCYEIKNRYMMEGVFDSLVGISAKSKNQAETLELLSLMQTDIDIITLLRYGVEGYHYELDDEGKPDNLTKGGAYSRSIGNKWMYLPVEEKYACPNYEAEYLKNLEEIEMIPNFQEFTVEQSMQLKKVRSITYKEIKVNDSVVGMQNYGGSLVQYSSKNFLEQIEERRTAFNESEYDRIAGEVNAKYGLE